MDIVVSEDLNGAVKFSSSLPHPNNLNRYVPGLSSSTSVAGPSFLKMGVGADVRGSSDPGPAVVHLGLSTPSPPHPSGVTSSVPSTLVALLTRGGSALQAFGLAEGLAPGQP